MYDIRLTTEAADFAEGASAVYGSIRIGNFEEAFIASLDEWAPERYELQWLDGARRLVAGERTSAFVTSFLPPNKSPYFVWWPSYRIDETVYVQNQLRFYGQLNEQFDVGALYQYVPTRKTVNDEGEKISEWSMPIEWLRAFVNRRDAYGRTRDSLKITQ